MSLWRSQGIGRLTRNWRICRIRDTVLRIHEAYIAGGAGAVKTNTYGVNSRLTEDPALRRRLLQRGYELACEAAGGKGTLVFADIGPAPEENAAVEYEELASVFLEAGAEQVPV